MKSLKILVLSLILISATTAKADESGICLLLTMEYTKSLPNYTRAQTVYNEDLADIKAGRQKYIASGAYVPQDYKALFEAQQAHMNKIVNGMKNNHCYTPEDEAAVQAMVK